MKHLKRVFLLILVFLSTLSLASCNWDIFKKDYHYSNTGKKEIETFFNTISSSDFSGSVSYTIKTNKNDNASNIEFFRQKNSSGEKLLFKLKDITQDISYSVSNDQSYYINHIDKTISTDVDDLIKGYEIMAMVTEYGIFNFEEDGEVVWKFIEKKQTTIKDKDGLNTKTIEYVYSYIQGQETLEDITTVKFNFDIKECKLKRIYYNFYTAENNKTTEVYVFVNDMKTNVSSSIFTLPTEQDGFTFITDSE